MPNVGYATLQVIPSVRGIADDLRRQLIGPAGDAGDAAGDAAGGGFRDSFAGTLAGIGVAEIAGALGSQFADAFGQAMEQANVQSLLKAQLGATSKDAARYGQVAGELYAKGIVDDVQAGAEAVRATLSGGLVPPDATNKQLKSIAAQMSDVATTFGTDMSMQSQAVAALLKNGLAPTAEEALDVITVGFQKLGPNAEDLLETFQEYPVQLRKLGLDSKTALGLFRQGLQGGARDTDIIADAFKELSIRSIDMSQSSQDAYKLLGLDAEKMSLQMAKGGEYASSGLQLILDRLRAIKDPVKQNAAAVGLFGTQAEDLGSALFKLDPSTAVKGFGDVSGAAAQLGKDLHSGPAHEIEVFRRGLKQTFVDLIGGQILPVLATAGRFMNSNVLPPLSAIGTVLFVLLMPALRGVWTAGTGVVNWLRAMGTWLIPVGILLVGFTASILAQQIAVAATTAVFAIYRGAILAWTAVQRGATIAQFAFNAAMAANPVGLIITAVIALGAALVVAYQRSETFRNIVQGAWAGIQVAAMAVWNGALKPMISGLVTGWQYVAAGAMWLWTTVLQPVFSFMSTAARIVATIYGVIFLTAFKVWWAGVQMYFGLVMTGVRAVGGAFSWLWASIVSPVIGWIVGGFKLWWAGAQMYFGLVTGGLRTVGGWAVWLWRSAFSPAIGWIVAGGRTLWAGVSVVLGWLNSGLKTTGGWATWLYRTAVKPAFEGVAAIASWLWSKGLKPALDNGKKGVAAFGDAFDAARAAIKVAWDKVEGIARAPIAFVVNTVYSKGIVPTWNTVAKAFGAPTLDAKHFAIGGPVFGAGTETSDDVPAWLSKNEHVWTAKEVRGAGGHGSVMALRKWAAAGGNGRLPGFAEGGGLFGWVKSAASKGVDLAKSGVSWLKDGLKASALAGLNKIVKPLIERISGSESLYRTMISGIPKKMLSAIFDFSGKADSKLAAAGIGGKGFKSALSFARAQAGKPYIWGGVGPTGYDCSGFMSALENIIRGVKSPYSRRWATGAFSGATAPAGWVRGAASPFRVGITNAGVGHTAGTLNGVNVESRGGDGVVVGARARGYNDRLFTDWYGLKGYSKGTRGATAGWAWVGELGPELVRFGGGEQVLNHRDSLRVAGSLGALPGYAKGTPKARKELPADLTAVFKALTGSAADIKKAFAELVKDLKAVGGAGKALAASTTKLSTKLQSLANQRDAVKSRIAEARTAAADQKKTAADYLGLSNLTGATSINDLIAGMKNRQNTLTSFRSAIRGAENKGLSKDLLTQLIALGPESDLARMVAGASKAQIKQLNDLAKSGAALSTSYGNSMADAMFDAGAMAGRGFLAGLMGQQAQLQRQMNIMASGMVGTIKKRLKIKSPSRVTAWVGEMTGAGVGVGLDRTATDVAAAAARVADAAVPEVPAVSPASYEASTGQGSGLTAGRRVYLVLEDGRELGAYVDDRADARVGAGFTAVRRRISSGSK
ncbi:replication protein [Streptomyces parvulus]|uniref:phage tail tape measure protein n=1 Tax=Streptomyces parvulus TaxID=146923 RepID=UPI001E367392|nr:phage tail tape measure protein [Streptomyces parvulus]MCC9154911.1 replication protein [Streptomyces parvulus]MCE7691244.1 replication protein [Streptomyces parvulus]